PVLPATEGPVSDPAELRLAAEAIGYPVVLKAAAGGGGKGMRRVNGPGEFEQAVRLTQGEAKSAFGDDRLYLERWLEKPRHIEVQILADSHGTVLAQADVRPVGASIEFRVYAEDPDQGFLPQAGVVRRLELPAGPGVRCDFGVRSGGAVPVQYDPLIGKIIVWGPSRAEAVERARRALD